MKGKEEEKKKTVLTPNVKGGKKPVPRNGFRRNTWRGKMEKKPS